MIRHWGRGVGQLLLKQQQRQRAVRSLSSYASSSNHVGISVADANGNKFHICHKSCEVSTRTLGQARHMSNIVAASANSFQAQKVAVRDFSTEELAAAKAIMKTPGKPYKVLIANRGEIAKRVIETCQKHGFPTVAIYSTADSKAPHVEMADEAICVGPAASNESYLDSEKVLKAIEMTNADAVHPGYGFMSENAEFAKTIIDAGKIWLGPPISAVHEMGDKIESKIIAKAANVTTIPGYKGVIDSIEHAIHIVNEGVPGEKDSKIGYPILLKAAAGGGGDRKSVV